MATTQTNRTPPIIEADTLIVALGRLNDYCSANPTTSLIIAADRVFKSDCVTRAILKSPAVKREAEEDRGK
jgi:hypothetical protein